MPSMRLHVNFLIYQWDGKFETHGQMVKWKAPIALTWMSLFESSSLVSSLLTISQLPKALVFVSSTRIFLTWPYNGLFYCSLLIFRLITHSEGLQELDLDDNLIGDLGGREILEALMDRKEGDWTIKVKTSTTVKREKTAVAWQPETHN